MIITSISIALFILILIFVLREYFILTTKLQSINNGLSKYDARNSYEYRTILIKVKQSRNLFISSTTTEEKIYWCNEIIASLKEIKNYLPNEVCKNIDLKVAKYERIFSSLNQKQIEKKKDEANSKINEKKDYDNNKNMGVA